MKIACIDVGSNTIRLLIGEINKKGHLKRLKSRRVVTALAKGLITSNKLNEHGKTLTLKTINYLLSLCHKNNVGHIFAIGTSALRDSLDGEEFVREIKDTTGLDIEIIDGQREAYLNYEGIRSSIDLSDKAIIIDIGGGSTEWIYKDGVDLTHASIPIGAIKLYDSFIHSDPPTKEEIDEVKTFLHSELSSSELCRFSLHNSQSFIATGGTATTLATIDMALVKYNAEKVHLHRISNKRVYDLFHHLISIPFKDRIRVRGLERKRARIIITGLLILISLMDLTGCREIIISDYGLLEGLIYERAKVIV